MNEKNVCTCTNDDVAKLILRLTVAILMLFHGIAKVQHGVGGIEGMLESAGLPTFIAYGVYISEIIAPLMLIFGFRVKTAALLIIATMIFVLAVPYADKVFMLTKHGAWAIELHIFYIMTSLAIFFLGAGKYSLDSKSKKVSQ